MKKIGLFGFVSACSLALAGGSLFADDVVLSASADNTLYQNQLGGVSNGAGAHMFAGTNSLIEARRGVLRFDVASHVPAGAVVESVALTLHMSRSNSGEQQVSLHTLLADWGEGTTDAPGEEGSGGLVTPGSATWVHRFFADDLWTTLGGDFTAAPSATQAVAGLGFYTWDSADHPALIADVQTWLDDPASDFGWAILCNEVLASSAKRFDTRENAEPSVRPRLEIGFRVIPAPCSVVVAALGLSAWIPRRRR